MNISQAIELNSSSLLLAIDSGNTILKWGLHDGRQWQARGSVSQSERMSLQQAWSALPVPAHILVSNVAGSQTADELAAWLARWHIQPEWIRSRASQCGVINRYTNPEQLGCDRWAALIAAWHKLQRACLVVDVGTAMTVDALSSAGEFLGGIIVPGPDTMKQALAERAEAFAIPVSGNFQDFPVNTGNALFSGIIQALAGAVERMYNQLCDSRQKEMAAEVIMTGGGAALLSPHMRIPHRIVDNLVLEGLVVMARAQARPQAAD